MSLRLWIPKFLLFVVALQAGPLKRHPCRETIMCMNTGAIKPRLQVNPSQSVKPVSRANYNDLTLTLLEVMVCIENNAQQKKNGVGILHNKPSPRIRERSCWSSQGCMRQCRRAARLQTLSLMDYNTPPSTYWELVVSQGIHHIALMTTNHQEASFNGIPHSRRS